MSLSYILCFAYGYLHNSTDSSLLHCLTCGYFEKSMENWQKKYRVINWQQSGMGQDRYGQPAGWALTEDWEVQIAAPFWRRDRMTRDTYHNYPDDSHQASLYICCTIPKVFNPVELMDLIFFNCLLLLYLFFTLCMRIYSLFQQLFCGYLHLIYVN